MLENYTNQSSSSARIENHTSLIEGEKLSEGVLAFLISVHVFLMVTTVFGNSMICAAVYKFRALRTPSNFILASLALSDILMGIVFFCRLVILTIGKHFNLACHTTSELAFTDICLILLHLCIISVERLLAIKYPLRYPSIITKSRAIIILCTIWSVAILGTAIIPHLQGHELEGISEFREAFHICVIPARNVKLVGLHKPYMIFAISFYFYLPFFIIVFSYSYIFKVSIEQRKRMKHVQNSFKRGTKRRNIELKAAKTLGLVLGVFTICFVPIFAGVIYQQVRYDSRYSAEVMSLMRILSLIASFSASVNPMVYTWGNLEFRKAFKILLTFRRKIPLDVSEKVAFSTTAGLITNAQSSGQNKV